MTTVVCAHHVYVGPSQAALEDGETARKCRECGWREHVLILGEIPPGTNDLHRMHHQAIGKLRARLKADAGWLIRESGVDGPPLEQARITLDFRWRTRTHRDADNYLAGCKGVIDALSGRWIVDDDVAHVEYVVRGHTGTGEPDRVVITIEPR